MTPQEQDTHHASRKWSFDKSVNIPTMLTIAAMVVSATAFGVNVINQRDLRMGEQDRRLDGIERKAESAHDLARRVELLLGDQSRNQDLQLKSLRDEVRTDLRDISGKLDTLIMNQGGMRPELKGWTKP